MYSVNGKRREAGLGSARDVSLVQARAKADAMRDVVTAGGDPLREKAATKTFLEVANELGTELKKSWRSPGQSAEWDRCLEYLAPLHEIAAGQLNVSDVKRAMKPLLDRPTVAAYALTIVKRVCTYASAHGYRDENASNPAVLYTATSRPRIKRQHHEAVPYREAPALMATLQARGDVLGDALTFIALTGCRKMEALDADWSEIDLASATWTIPLERMKTGTRDHAVPHVVPLTPPAVALLMRQPTVPTARGVGERQKGRVFVTKRKRRLPPSCFKYIVAKMNGTVHGLRSALRDYLGNETDVPREIAEGLLAHVVGGVEGAYRREIALRKHRDALTIWAKYLGFTWQESEAVPTQDVADQGREAA